KIATAKKDKVEYDLENSYLQQYGVSAYGAAPASALAPLGAPIPLNRNLNSMSRNELLREIEGLNARLNNLYGYGVGNTTTILTTPSATQGGYYPYQSQTPIVSGLVPGNAELRWKIDSLQHQVSLLSTPETAIEKKDE